MRTLKKWYTYKRNGILYVQFKDKMTGKKLTAKSTGTRIQEDAHEIISAWDHDPDSFFNQNQKKTAKNELQRIIQDACLDQQEIVDAFQTAMLKFVSEQPVMQAIAPAIQNNARTIVNKTIAAKPLSPLTSNEQEIQKIVQKIDTLTFADYLFWYFDYDNSPNIAIKRNNGERLPERERYDSLVSIFKYHIKTFPAIRLIDITENDINIIMGTIKNKKNLSEAYMVNIKKAFVEALRFVLKYDIITTDFINKLTKFSNKNKLKEIFTQAELQYIFNKENNIFGDEAFYLVNKLLLTTGCRTGEILALQIKDIHKTFEGYKLYIGKNYNFKSWRLKATKTGREDYVPISEELAQELYRFIEKNPFKKYKDGFIFYSSIKDMPLRYDAVQRNFEKVMKQEGIKRKNLTLHSYRHTFTTILQDAGYSDSDLLYLTRHKSLKDTRLYSNHFTPEKETKMREAMQLVENFT